MIPLNEAIEAGAWLQAKTDELLFRFKPISFSKIDLASIDNLEESKTASIELDSNICLLELSIMNLCKTETSIDMFKRAIKLIDEEGYEFSAKDIYPLSHDSKFARGGLVKFYSGELPPKISKSGAFTFELPDSFEQLFLTIKDGEISEA